MVVRLVACCVFDCGWLVMFINSAGLRRARSYTCDLLLAMFSCFVGACCCFILLIALWILCRFVFYSSCCEFGLFGLVCCVFWTVALGCFGIGDLGFAVWWCLRLL